MLKRIGIETSLAVAEAVNMAKVDVVSAYPITPQTHIVEHLSEIVADGHLDAEFVPVESEHSAMSCCCGSSAAGARTFTATACPGPGADARDPVHRLGDAPAHRHGGGQPGAFGAHLHLERPRRRDGRAGHGLDPALRGKRPGGHRGDPGGLQGGRGPSGSFAHHRQLRRLHPEPRDRAHRVPGTEDRGRYLPPYKPTQQAGRANPATFGPVGMPEIYIETRRPERGPPGLPARHQGASDELGKVFGGNTTRWRPTDKTTPRRGVRHHGLPHRDRHDRRGRAARTGQGRWVRSACACGGPSPRGLQGRLQGRGRLMSSTAPCPPAVGGPVASGDQVGPLRRQGRPLDGVHRGIGGRDVPVDDFKEMYEQGAKVEPAKTSPTRAPGGAPMHTDSTEHLRYRPSSCPSRSCFRATGPARAARRPWPCATC